MPYLWTGEVAPFPSLSGTQVGYITDPAGYTIDLVIEHGVVTGTPGAPPDALHIPIVDDDAALIAKLRQRIRELEK